MAKMTSAYANKLLNQLNEDKDFWTTKERESYLYTAAVNEEPVIPEYDYSEVAATIAEIDEKICKIKHAINLANVTNTVEVNGAQISIDTILVKMAQYNKRKLVLDNMRKQLPKTRVNANMYNGRNAVPEYQYINYDLDLIKKEYEELNCEIMAMQIALDKYNQTYEFEVEI